MKLPNTKIFIIIAGAILVVLIAVTIFVSGLTKESQSPQSQPTLIPTGVFESGSNFNSGSSNNNGINNELPAIETEEETENLQSLSEEEENRLEELKNRTPVDSADSTIGYSPTLSKYFVTTKTPKGENAFRQYIASNQLTNVLVNFPELFNISDKPLDQFISQTEDAVQKKKDASDKQLQTQSDKQQSQKKQGSQSSDNKSNRLQPMIDLMQALVNLDFGDVPESENGGSGTSNGGGSGNLPDGQTYKGPGTPQLSRIISVIKAVPGLTWGGVCVTSGHMENSEHYHCNAMDIFGGEELLDSTFAGLLTAAKNDSLPIHCIIYERYSYSRESGWAKHSYSGASTHDNHIHISGWPSVGGAC